MKKQFIVSISLSILIFFGQIVCPSAGFCEESSAPHDNMVNPIGYDGQKPTIKPTVQPIKTQEKDALLTKNKQQNKNIHTENQESAQKSSEKDAQEEAKILANELASIATLYDDSAEDIEVETRSGFTIVGTLVLPENAEKVPLVLFVHMIGGKKDDFKKLAMDLFKKGYGVLSVDLRGHGSSFMYKKQKYHWRNFNTKAWDGMDKDIQDVISYLTTDYEAEIDTNRIGIIAAGLGANVSVFFAAENSDKVKTMVLLSPGVRYKSYDIRLPIVNYGTNSLLMIASATHEYSEKSCKTLLKFAQGETEVQLFKGISIGTDMLKYRPKLHKTITDWIIKHLGSIKNTGHHQTSPSETLKAH